MEHFLKIGSFDYRDSKDSTVFAVFGLNPEHLTGLLASRREGQTDGKYS
jgi:hypothetical protein